MLWNLLRILGDGKAVILSSGLYNVIDWYHTSVRLMHLAPDADNSPDFFLWKCLHLCWSFLHLPRLWHEFSCKTWSLAHKVVNNDVNFFFRILPHIYAKRRYEALPIIPCFQWDMLYRRSCGAIASYDHLYKISHWKQGMMGSAFYLLLSVTYKVQSVYQITYKILFFYLWRFMMKLADDQWSSKT